MKVFPAPDLRCEAAWRQTMEQSDRDFINNAESNDKNVSIDENESTDKNDTIEEDDPTKEE